MRDFEDAWNDIDKLVKETLTNIVVESVSSLYKEIIDRTPIGRPELWSGTTVPANYTPGQLRLNWQIDFGRGFQFTTGDFTAKNASIADSSSYKLGNTIRIKNDTEYAERIEFGHSRIQAPEGMMRVSVIQTSKFVNDAVKRNKL